MPVAPGRLSTTTGCFQASCSFSPTMRASTSGGLPGGSGTTILTGREG